MEKSHWLLVEGTREMLPSGSNTETRHDITVSVHLRSVYLTSSSGSGSLSLSLDFLLTPRPSVLPLGPADWGGEQEHTHQKNNSFLLENGAKNGRK